MKRDGYFSSFWAPLKTLDLLKKSSTVVDEAVVEKTEMAAAESEMAEAETTEDLLNEKVA